MGKGYRSGYPPIPYYSAGHTARAYRHFSFCKGRRFSRIRKGIQEVEMLPAYFSAFLLSRHPADCLYFQPFLQEFVQIIVRKIVYRLVTYLPALPLDFTSRRLARPVVIQETTDMAVFLQDIHRFGQVGHRIKHHAVRNGLPPFERKVGKVIHETFEHQDRRPVLFIRASSDMCNVLGGYGSLEIRIPQLIQTFG